MTHSTTYVFIRSAVSFVREQENNFLSPSESNQRNEDDAWNKEISIMDPYYGDDDLLPPLNINSFSQSSRSTSPPSEIRASHVCYTGANLIGISTNMSNGGGILYNKLPVSGTRTDKYCAVVSQQMNYAFRGTILHDLCFMEYCCIIEIVSRKLVEKKKPRINIIGSRIINAYFKFSRGHPLRKTHVQRIASKQKVPVLNGGQPPNFRYFEDRDAKYSDADPTMQSELREAALYYTTLLSKWTQPLDNNDITNNQEGLMQEENKDNINPSIPVEIRIPSSGTTWDNFTSMMKSFEMPSNQHDMLPSFRDRCRSKYIKNVSKNLRITSETNKKISMKYRSRETTLWNNKNVGPADINQYITNKYYGLQNRQERHDYTEQVYLSEGLHDPNDIKEIERIKTLAEGNNVKKMTESNKIDAAYLQRASTDINDLYRLDAESEKFFHSINLNNNNDNSDNNDYKCSNIGIYQPSSNDTDESFEDNYYNDKDPGDVFNLLTKRNIIKLKDREYRENNISIFDNSIETCLQWSSAVNDINAARIRANAQNPEGFQVEKFSPDQLHMLHKCAENIDATELYHQDMKNQKEPEQMLWLILGGPGSGKTTLFNVLAALFEIREEKYHSCKHASCSFTGKAAVLLRDGWTLHQLLQLSAAGGSPQNKIFAPLQKGTKAFETLHINCKNLNTLLIDEVSMIYAVMLGQANERLKQALHRNGK